MLGQAGLTASSGRTARLWGEVCLAPSAPAHCLASRLPPRSGARAEQCDREPVALQVRNIYYRPFSERAADLCAGAVLSKNNIMQVTCVILRVLTATFKRMGKKQVELI